MKCIIDTAVFLWMIFDERGSISRKALKTLEGDNTELYFSAASVWEIAIKHKIGKLELKKNPADWLPTVILKMGLRPMPIFQQHALANINLPLHHRDPFDRLIACQAKLEKMSLITPYKIFKRYGVSNIL